MFDIEIKCDLKATVDIALSPCKCIWHIRSTLFCDIFRITFTRYIYYDQLGNKTESNGQPQNIKFRPTH